MHNSDDSRCKQCYLFVAQRQKSNGHFSCDSPTEMKWELALAAVPINIKESRVVGAWWFMAPWGLVSSNLHPLDLDWCITESATERQRENARNQDFHFACNVKSTMLGILLKVGHPDYFWSPDAAGPFPFPSHSHTSQCSWACVCVVFFLIYSPLLLEGEKMLAFLPCTAACKQEPQCLNPLNYALCKTNCINMWSWNYSVDRTIWIGFQHLLKVVANWN